MLEVVLKAVACKFSLDRIGILLVIILIHTAALYHKVLDNAVEDKTVVEFIGNQLLEILNCCGSDLREESDCDLAVIFNRYDNVICFLIGFCELVYIDLAEVKICVCGGFVVAGHERERYGEKRKRKTKKSFHNHFLSKVYILTILF